MVRFFSSIIASLSGSARPRKTTPPPRQARLGLESLEGRALPSVSPIAVAVPLTGQISTVSVAPALPSFQGRAFQFYQRSAVLAIQTETYLPDGSATFTGAWTPRWGATTLIQNGTLKYTWDGNIKISFVWVNFGATNTFEGTTSIYPLGTSEGHNYGQYGQATLGRALYHLAGVWTTDYRRPDGSVPGPENWTGDEVPLPPPVFTV